MTEAPAQKRPVLTIDPSPSILDIIGTLKEEHDAYPAEIDKWIRNFNEDNETSYGVDDLPESDAQQCLFDVFHDDYDRYQWHWDDTKDCFQDLLSEAGFEDGDLFVVEASPCDWTGRSGQRTFEYNGSAEQFITESFASVDRNQFHARLWEINKKELKATVSCHDIPTGASMDIIKVHRCENSNCGDLFVPKHKNHVFCTGNCRKENRY